MARAPKTPTAPRAPAAPRPIEAMTHPGEARRNIPTAEFQSIAQQMEESAPAPAAHYKRAAPLPPGETRPRNADLDPQRSQGALRSSFQTDAC